MIRQPKDVLDLDKSSSVNNLPNLSIMEGNTYNIQKKDDDWRKVEFHLKSSISSDVEIKRILSVKNTHMNRVFEGKVKNKLTTYAWYNFNGIPDEKNILSKLRSKGFEVPANGIEFKVGSIYEENNNPELSSEGETVYILCQILIRRSYCKIVRGPMEFS
jgi:hypothetical protein